MSDSARICRTNNLAIPNYRLNVSRNQFLYCGTTVWNDINNKIFKISNLNKQTQIVAGENFLSDLSTPISLVKRKFKEILFNLQSAGDDLEWEKHNFEL